MAVISPGAASSIRIRGRPWRRGRKQRINQCSWNLWRRSLYPNLKDGEHIEIKSRNNRDLTAAYPGIAASALGLKAQTAVVDGEIVALDSKAGRHFKCYSIDRSMRIITSPFMLSTSCISTVASSQHQPLHERRADLPKVLKGSGLHAVDGLAGAASDIIAAVRKMGLEGVIAKRKDSVYEPGERSGAWQKLKLELQQEFVIGGYRPGNNGIDALLVGYYSGSRLMFAGKVRAGFVPHVRRQLTAKLKPLHVEQCLFMNLPDVRSSRWGGGVTEDEMREMQWVKPQLVVQIRFVEWTAEGRLRHAVYVGERLDKRPLDVRREVSK